MTVRVVLADDQTVVRAGFRALLDLTDDLVVAEAADGARAVEAVRTTRPDVVLMDIRMPGVDGLEATRRIAGDRSLDGVRVVMLTTYQVGAYVSEALRHGAAGFLLKDIEPDDLRAAIRTVAEGRGLLDPAVTRRVIEAFATFGPFGAEGVGEREETQYGGVLRRPAVGGRNDDGYPRQVGRHGGQGSRPPLRRRGSRGSASRPRDIAAYGMENGPLRAAAFQRPVDESPTSAGGEGPAGPAAVRRLLTHHAFVSERRPDLTAARVLTYDPQIDAVVKEFETAGRNTVASVTEIGELAP